MAAIPGTAELSTTPKQAKLTPVLSHLKIVKR